MELLIHSLILLFGFIFLVKGADIFTDGASNIAKFFKVPSFLIGLTIVAFGTSAPELAVSAIAAFQNSNEIALSNVIGSDIFNFLIVLGVCAMIEDLPVNTEARSRDFPLFIFSSVFITLAATRIHSPFNDVYPEMTSITGILSRGAGIILLIVFLIYMRFIISEMKSKQDKENNNENEDNKPLPSMSKNTIMTIIGLILIISGGEMTVKGAEFIALSFGLTKTFVGLTIVAIGTSLPELVTSVIAVKKGETGLAVGNALGSNIFNNMLILGVSSLIHPITVYASSIYSLSILMCISFVIWILASSSKTIKRGEGFLLILLYILNMTTILTR